ncbi:hypothetical protein A0J61_11362, partial [Choanephora cucurbitarum]
MKAVRNELAKRIVSNYTETPTSSEVPTGNNQPALNENEESRSRSFSPMEDLEFQVAGVDPAIQSYYAQSLPVTGNANAGQLYAEEETYAGVKQHYVVDVDTSSTIALDA